jgi:hypothetical protein
MHVIKQQLQQIAARQKRQRKATTRTALSRSKHSPIVTDRGTLTMRDAVFLFLSGSAFAGITTSLLWVLGSMPQ